MRQIKSSILILLVVAIALFFMAYTMLFEDKSYRNVVNLPDVEVNSLLEPDKNQRDTKIKPTFNSSMPYGQEIADVLDVARHMNVKPLLVTLINGAYLQFALSWLCNTEHMGIHKQVLIISTDLDTKDTIKKQWPDINVVAISGMPLNGDQSYSHAGYVRLTNFRAHVLLELLLINQEVFLFEVDALWIKNPVPVLSSTKNADILANPVSERPGLTAIGFLYLFPTNPTILTWKELNRRLYELDKKIKSMPAGKLISEGDNDQIYVSGIINKRLGGLQKKELPLADYPDGKWYVMSEAKRKASRPYVINNNWVIGNKNKILRAKMWGHWFLSDDGNCNITNIKRITEDFWHPLEKI